MLFSRAASAGSAHLRAPAAFFAGIHECAQERCASDCERASERVSPLFWQPPGLRTLGRCASNNERFLQCALLSSASRHNLFSIPLEGPTAPSGECRPPAHHVPCLAALARVGHGAAPKLCCAGGRHRPYTLVFTFAFHQVLIGRLGRSEPNAPAPAPPSCATHTPPRHVLLLFKCILAVSAVEVLRLGGSPVVGALA